MCTTACTNFVAPALQLNLSEVKQFGFSWAPVIGAEYYQLLERSDLGQQFVQVGQNIVGQSVALTVPLYLRMNASYKLRACKIGEGCVESAVMSGLLAAHALSHRPPLEEIIGYHHP